MKLLMFYIEGYFEPTVLEIMKHIDLSKLA